MTIISPEQQVHFGGWLIDTLLEHHECYLRWDDLLAMPDHASLLEVKGQPVLLPFSPSALTQYDVVRAALDPTAELATLVFARPPDGATGSQQWGEGAVLIARKVPILDLYVSVVWHDWYVSNRAVMADGREAER